MIYWLRLICFLGNNSVLLKNLLLLPPINSSTNLFPRFFLQKKTINLNEPQLISILVVSKWDKPTSGDWLVIPISARFIPQYARIIPQNWDKPTSVEAFPQSATRSFPTQALIPRRFPMTSVGAESFGISWRFGNLLWLYVVFRRTKHVEANLQILKYLCFFEFNPEFIYIYIYIIYIYILLYIYIIIYILLCIYYYIYYYIYISIALFFSCVLLRRWISLKITYKHTSYSIHLTPSAYCSLWCSVCVMHKGFSLFLWSSSFIPQNTLPVMGPTIYIYLLPCFGWVSTHLETSGKWNVHFCNRKLKCFTTLKLWKSDRFLMVPHPLEVSSDLANKWNLKPRFIHYSWFHDIKKNTRYFISLSDIFSLILILVWDSEIPGCFKWPIPSEDLSHRPPLEVPLPERNGWHDQYRPANLQRGLNSTFI